MSTFTIKLINDKYISNGSQVAIHTRSINGEDIDIEGKVTNSISTNKHGAFVKLMIKKDYGNTAILQLDLKIMMQ